MRALTYSRIHEAAVLESIDYLKSDKAIQSIEANPYWPKWNSPWWHMSVLWEMGLADRIPKATAQKMLSEVKRTHLPYFFRDEAPADKAPDQDSSCPCALGNIYQILSATELDVDEALPWVRSWFLKYQMPDGGLNCDEDAYQADANASSIVGTIAPLEAILSAHTLTAQEEQFLDRGAQCLINRELRLGSSSKHNAEERLDEQDWLKLCFPRFYFYDVLRGLNFILKWATIRNRPLPWRAVATVIKYLETQSQDDQICIGRHSYEGVRTKIQSESRECNKRSPASHFPLMDQVSQIGAISPYLTRRWIDAKEQIGLLKSKGLLR